MSLDFYLESADETEHSCVCSNCGNEHTNKYREEFYSSNITHNLGLMFEHVGLYQILWHGDGRRASEILPELEEGLADMKARKEFFEQFNSPNGWGTYIHAVPWLAEVIKACREYPDAIIRCSR